MGEVFFAADEDEAGYEEDNDQPAARGGRHPAGGALLIDGDGNFCMGPKEKVHAFLDVGRYVSQWPLIPTAELHASSVQHPDDSSMRWLLHSRRVPCLPSGDVAQLAKPGALPRCAGVGEKDATVWCCKLCAEALCTQHPLSLIHI